MDIHLNHTWVRRHPDHIHSRVMRGRIALDMHRQTQRLGRGLCRRDEIEVILDSFHRRHEDAKPPVARLHTERGSDRTETVAEILLHDILHRAACGKRPRLLPARGVNLGADRPIATLLILEIRQRPAQL
ncbi:hypothetical protein GALL_553360 [mine drainage metagenome]|uniref:Uncharacterized protein n=1 Tax=mine drainage metagenome TaxID=410659 RepID=A0A1J5PHU0_9ZZZZ